MPSNGYHVLREVRQEGHIDEHDVSHIYLVKKYNSFWIMCSYKNKYAIYKASTDCGEGSALSV